MRSRSHSHQRKVNRERAARKTKPFWMRYSCGPATFKPYGVGLHENMLAWRELNAEIVTLWDSCRYRK